VIGTKTVAECARKTFGVRYFVPHFNRLKRVRPTMLWVQQNAWQSRSVQALQDLYPKQTLFYGTLWECSWLHAGSVIPFSESK